MTTNPWWMSRWFVWPCLLFYIAVGLLLTLITSVFGPSFWYFPCAIFLSAGSFFWYSPRRGAAFSFPLALVFAFMLLKSQPWRWHEGWFTSFGLPALILIALVIPIAVLAIGRTAWKVMLLSLCLALTSFCVDRAFTNKVEVRTLTMEWTVDGHTPWGEDTELGPHGETPVVIYERIDGAYCYDAIFSDLLKAQLEKSGKQQIKVEYNIFRSFGKDSGYNEHSVDGMVFNEGHKTVVEADGYGGMTLDSSEGRTYTSHCNR